MITEGFDQIKQTILKNLSDGIDFSPKGSIDLPVRDLVYLINKHPDYVTTSSCSGRISISLPSNESKGVNWLLVKHSFVELQEIVAVLSNLESIDNENSLKLVTLKCEPFIMHLCCRDAEHAKQLHTVAMDSGFRESGITLGSKKVMLAIRTTAFNLELPIARNHQLLFPESYLKLILDEANHRLKLNFARIDRFLTQFKNIIGYPHIQFSKIFHQADKSWSKRWGHIAVPTIDNKSVILLGGQGVEKMSMNQLSQEISHSGRNLQSVKFTDGDGFQLASVEGISSCMHCVGINICSSQDQFFILSGGRQSPTKAFPCSRVYVQTTSNDNNLSYQIYDNFREVGDIPSPRWGHSLHPIRCNSNVNIDEYPQQYFLFGGRNESKIFADAFMLSILQSKDDNCITLEWKLLEFQMHSGVKLTVNQMLGRVYYASCVMKQDIYHPSSSNFAHDNDYNCSVLVHGGIVSLIDPSPTDCCFIIDPVELTIQQLFSSIPCPRHSHTVTPILGKSLLMFGGVSNYDRSCAYSEEIIVGEKSKLLRNDNLIIDYGWNSDGSIKFYQTRSLSWDFVNTVDNGSIYVDNELPCQECRCNHQLVYFLNRTDSTSSFLYVIGGGATTLAFGDHYCCSMKGEVTMHNVMHMNQSNVKSNGNVNGIDEKHTKSSFISNVDSSEEMNPVLLINTSHVKAVKTWLEKNSWLNKKFKIFSVEINVLEGASSVILHTTDQPDGFREKLMAIPIKQSFLQKLQTSSSNDSANWLHDLQSILPQINRLFYLSHYDISLDSQFHGENNLEKVIVSGKMKASDGAKSSNELLRSLILNAQMPAACMDDIPKKYEFVGDIVMIPENSLLHPAWERWNVKQIEQQKSSLWHLISDCFRGKRVARKAFIRNNELRQSQVQLLYVPTATSDITVVSNTSDKVDITSNNSSFDGNPEGSCTISNQINTSIQKKMLKLCKCGHDHAAQAGWVTVLENKIGFAFDITRVMFCSGNITERMRMGKYVMNDNEVVVDFYAGIGYYTVPILFFHPKIKHLYACEWNPDSILSLRHNLITNGVDSSRYTIIAGDNRITSVERLHNVADRILLGLLPSSTQGWVLAVRALKLSGGIIHVHENIFEKDLDDWLKTMKTTFKRLFEEVKNQDMELSILHIEKVKSYAPRVYHYVIDIKCSPRVLQIVN